MFIHIYMEHPQHLLRIIVQSCFWVWEMHAGLRSRNTRIFAEIWLCSCSNL